MAKQLILFGAQYLYLVIAVLAGIFVFSRPKELRLRLLISLVIAFPLTYLVAKLGSVLIENPRPFVLSGIPPLFPHTADNGFPSDHTLFSAAFAALILWSGKRLGIVLMGMALLVGYARVLAGVHHLMDVIGSMAVAISVTWIVWRYVTTGVLEKYFSKKTDKS
ncbi:MAG: phosphatase PAP2 family protein [Candidatus Moranbacteria bacterium]|nr:phosphatase PAP2 family protein [Candidatus Moranbacteria bacterium]